MTLIRESKIREVQGISNEQKLRIEDFLQGAVYCWCKNRPDEWFSMRDLMGGSNFYWEGTPLFDLFQKHENIGKNNNDAIAAAGKDSGWILKKVIHEDKRKFDTKKEELIRKYRWNGNE
ncbi:MAG: hypothetical protein ACEPO8_02260 [Rhodothermaceae bacterium]